MFKEDDSLIRDFKDGTDLLEKVKSAYISGEIMQIYFYQVNKIYVLEYDIKVENNQILINSFRGKYFFLSNFYPCQVKYDGITYKNSEAAFQAQKVLDKKERQQFADLEPLDAKKLGKKVSLRGDWEKVKVEIMYSVVKAKFEQNSYLSRQLIDTNDAKLVEGNSYHDIFWGIDMDSGIGENYLGRILMKVREMVLKVNLYEFQLLWQSSIGDANDMLSGNHKAPNINKDPATENSWKIKKTSPKYKIHLHEFRKIEIPDPLA